MILAKKFECSPQRWQGLLQPLKMLIVPAYCSQITDVGMERCTGIIYVNIMIFLGEMRMEAGHPAFFYGMQMRSKRFSIKVCNSKSTKI